MSEYITMWVVRPENSCIREEVVRCMDCEFFNFRDEECGGRNWCKRMSFEVTLDGFCAWGKRWER